MKEQLTIDLSGEINRLHDKLTGLARTSLEKAIEIGDLLTRQKAELKHGQWLPWCAENLEFSKNTVSRYMGVYLNREKLPTVGNLELTEAYRLLSQPAEVGGDTETDERPTEIDFEPTPEPSTIIPSLETKEQKEAAWDIAQEQAESEDSPMTAEHMAAAAEAVKDSVKENAEDIKEESRPHVHVSANSGENEWYTPSAFIDAAKSVMGGIDLDPASSLIANERVGASSIYTKEDNGLEQPWEGRVWMNPPYAQPLIAQFAERLCGAYRRGVTDAVVLVNNASDTRWWQGFAAHCDAICCIKGRVKFLDPDGNEGAPLQGQTVFYFGPDPFMFSEFFSSFGTCFKK